MGGLIYVYRHTRTRNNTIIVIREKPKTATPDSETLIFAEYMFSPQRAPHTDGLLVQPLQGGS